MPGVQPYAWDVHRRRTRKLRGALWLLLPAALVAVVAVELRTPLLAVVPGLAWLAFVAAAVTHAEYAPCPRCGEPFGRKGVFHNSFTRKCLHCELPKWSTGEPSPAG